MTWKAESLLAAVFLKPGTPTNASDIWQKIFGSAPDAFQRSTAPNAPPGSTAQGARDGLQINISSQVGRVDFVCLPGPLGMTEEFPAIEDYRSALTKLSSYAGKFAENIAVPRVGVVLNLNQVAKPEEVGSLISRQTGVPFPSNALDPLYQFNVRRALSSRTDVTVNRLCTWGTGEAQMLTVNPQTGGSPIIVVAQSFVTLKVDVNTLPNGPELSAGSAQALVSELSDIACDIANRGIEAF